MTFLTRLKLTKTAPPPVVALLAIWGLGCLSVLPRFSVHPVYAGLSFIFSTLLLVSLCLRQRWAFWVVLLFNMFVFQAAAGFAVQRSFSGQAGRAWDAAHIVLPLICILLCFSGSSLAWFAFSSIRRARWTGIILFVVMALPSFCIGARSGGVASPNQPAAGKAGIARLLAIEHHCPGLPEPDR